MIAVVALSTAVGAFALAWWEVYIIDMGGLPLSQTFSGAWLRYGMLGLLFAWAYTYYRDREEAREAMRQSEVDRVELEQRMAEARLIVLQAQIEPHFLFNTLANVKRLYATDPVSASVMLDNLMRYLTVALPQMRVTESTLEREAGLGQAYLNSQKI
jgi:hypothetical protein